MARYHGSELVPQDTRRYVGRTTKRPRKGDISWASTFAPLPADPRCVYPATVLARSVTRPHPNLKVQARHNVADFLATQTEPRYAIRINGLDTPWWEDDLRATVVGGVALASIVVPKVETVGQLELIDAVLGELDPEGFVRTQALIETALGMRDVDLLASSSPRLDTLVLGYADLSASLRRPIGRPANFAWLAVQDRIMLAARCNGLAAMDGPWLKFDDQIAGRQNNRQAVDMGFDGKWAIHPCQVADIHYAFSPSEEEIAAARSVVEAFDLASSEGAAVVAVDGLMIDAPVADAARAVLARVGGPGR